MGTFNFAKLLGTVGMLVDFVTACGSRAYDLFVPGVAPRLSMLNQDQLSMDAVAIGYKAGPLGCSGTRGHSSAQADVVLLFFVSAGQGARCLRA